MVHDSRGWKTCSREEVHECWGWELMLTLPHRYKIIGVGNEFRSDDAVGIFIARRLSEKNFSRAVVMECSGEGTALMDAWSDAETVLLIDAVRTGNPAGTIFRLNALSDALPKEFFHYSSHAFGVGEAIALAREMQTLPPRLSIYGIEGRTFAFGTEMSPEVKASAGVVIEEIIHTFNLDSLEHMQTESEKNTSNERTKQKNKSLISSDE